MENPNEKQIEFYIDILQKLKGLREELLVAEAGKCVCSGWTIQYEQGCQCGYRLKIRTIRQKIIDLVKTL